MKRSVKEEKYDIEDEFQRDRILEDDGMNDDGDDSATSTSVIYRAEEKVVELRRRSILGSFEGGDVLDAYT